MDVEFVAELSSNHNKDIDRCIRFIETAKAIGCDAVKFQLFQISQLFTPELLNNRADLRRRAAWELPLEFLPRLYEKCKQEKIRFSCTPFYLEAVEELRPYVDFYKVASYELLWTDILKCCCLTHLPIVISTGMANIDETDQAMRVVSSCGAKEVTLLHCVSNYPAVPQQCNLAAIKTMRDRYGGSVGWSDHSVNASVIYRAVYKWNASMVEFHLDIDGKGEEYKGGHCWLPHEISPVIDDIRNGTGRDKAYTSADGSGIKQPSESEMIEREWRADPCDGLRPLRVTREFQENK
ncbi:MAG: N-acetylneuraminate synthase family protein [Sedimentisphaerales bacterium]